MSEFLLGEVIVLLRILLVLVAVVGLSTSGCNNAQFRQDAVSYGGHDYKVFYKPLTWEQAQIRCQEMGGNLASITSSEENDFIVSLLREDLYPHYTCCWIGSKEDAQGNFTKWVSGERVGMPDYVLNHGSDERYLNLRISSGRWEDYPNRGEIVGEQWFICEW